VGPWTARLSGTLVLSLLLICGILAGCASPPSQASHEVSVDTRLIGPWRAMTAQVAGHDPLRADSWTTASLTFRHDGLLITNGESCGAPHFIANGRHITLHWPRSSDCFTYSVGAPGAVSLRLADLVERLEETQSGIRYVVRGTTTLIVAAGRYRVVFRRGPPPQTPAMVGPSSPGLYSGTASTTPPR
jgi:hypothetical protein